MRKFADHYARAGSVQGPFSRATIRVYCRAVLPEAASGARMTTTKTFQRESGAARALALESGAALHRRRGSSCRFPTDSLRVARVVRPQGSISAVLSSRDPRRLVWRSGPRDRGHSTFGAGGHVFPPPAGGLRGRRSGRPTIAGSFRRNRAGDRVAEPAPSLGGRSAARVGSHGNRPRRTAGRHPQHNRRRHHRHRRERRHRGVQSRRRAAVRLSRVRSPGAKRQHADALAVPRGA